MMLGVAVAGGFGSVLRMVASKWTGALPWGILAANIVASGLAMAAKLGFGAAYPDSPVGFGILVGVAGGLSTFSAFVGQIGEYFKIRQFTKAGVYTLLTLVLSSTAVIAVLEMSPALLK
jgi:CrcB protein